MRFVVYYQLADVENYSDDGFLVYYEEGEVKAKSFKTKRGAERFAARQDHAEIEVEFP